MRDTISQEQIFSVGSFISLVLAIHAIGCTDTPHIKVEGGGELKNQYVNLGVQPLCLTALLLQGIQLDFPRVLICLWFIFRRC